MEEDIKILEDFIKYFEAEATQTKYRRNISITVGEDDIQAIENLIKGYRELKEITNKYDAFANDYMPNDVKMIIADREYFNNGFFKENFIPKSKIKEIIENWKNQSTYYGSNIVNDLQELMGEN